MPNLLAHGQLLVVETEDEVFLGTVEVGASTLTVRSGYVGRPVILDAGDVVRVTLASEHEDVVDSD